MPDKPNIIFFFPDQLRADFLGCYGAGFSRTPNIDRLQERGVRYERCYSPHPVCVPARVSLLTGMHGVKTGVLDNGQFLRPDYADLGLQVWPEILNANGYYTAAIGKMHFYPWDLRLGFQYRAIAEDKRWLYVRDDYYHHLRAHRHRKYHGNEHPGYYENRGAVINKLPWEHSVDHFVGQQARRFVLEYGDEGPFAMMVGFPGPHCPYDPNPEFLQKIDPEVMPKAIPEVAGDAPGVRRHNVEGNKLPWNGVDYSEFTDAQKIKIRAHYAALVTQIDHEVGQILEVLRRKGLLENTILIFSSDHGDYLGDHNLIGKGTFYESSIHVPLIVHVPRTEEAAVCQDLVSLSDVTATMLCLAGCDVPGYMDSIPLPGLGLPRPAPRECIIGMIQGGWMIDDGEWRLSKYDTGENLLFNVCRDPEEQQNLFVDPAYIDVCIRLDARLMQG